LKTSFRFVHAIWAGDDRSSSSSGAGDGSGDTGRANVVRSGAGGEWDDADGARADRGPPVAEGDFDLRLNLRMHHCFILEIERYGMKQGSRCALSGKEQGADARRRLPRSSAPTRCQATALRPAPPDTPSVTDIYTFPSRTRIRTKPIRTSFVFPSAGFLRLLCGIPGDRLSPGGPFPAQQATPTPTATLAAPAPNPLVSPTPTLTPLPMSPITASKLPPFRAA
jgi:hypothetical protein